MTFPRRPSIDGLGYCVAPEVAEALDGAKIDLQEPGADSDSGNLVIVPAD